MNIPATANMRFRQRLDHFYNYISHADQERIGSSALPEFYSYDHESRELVLKYRFEEWMLNCNGFFVSRKPPARFELHWTAPVCTVRIN